MTQRPSVRAALASAPLILSSAASADFVGLKAVSKPVSDFFAQWVDLVVNVYAEFSDDDGDGIGDGAVIAVAGLPGLEANVSVRDGVFYQNPLNTSNAGRTAPSLAFAGLFPSVLVDTFVTIGLKGVPAGHADTTVVTPTFPFEGDQPGRNPDGSWTDTRLQLNDAAWFAFNPDSDQTRPDNFDNPPTQVLIGQFSVEVGAGPDMGVSGTLLVQGENGDGSVFQEYLSFDSPSPGALGVIGIAGLLGWPRRRRSPPICSQPC
ncbi:MAG: hypothetical protein ACYSTY_04810 [Planctomycetota bacterium]|jgi:MYXO-CTERM domain-containing protein